MASEAISYDKKELRSVITAFKAMDDEAVAQAKKESSALAEFAAGKIKQTAATRTVSGTAARRIADGVVISKSSKVGEFSYGFARQKFSGGGSTLDLLYGMEFGSNRFKQFPSRTPSKGRGNSGYFIYSTLRQIQPELVQRWEEAFNKILKEWDK
jgi:hypothetical protein